MERKKTRYKDKHGHPIYTGDIIFVEEYPDRYVDGSLAFEGIVGEENGRVVVTYIDIGEEESMSLSYFPVAGREIYTKEERYKYWKTQLLGGEPPKDLWDWTYPWEDVNQPAGNGKGPLSLNWADLFENEENKNG